MRISASALEALREAIAPLDTEAARDRYRRGDYPRAELVRDVNKRYRWDLFYAARGSIIVADEDLSDAHVYTALRSMVADVTT